MNRNQSAAAVIFLMYAAGVPADGDATNGQRLYESRCIGCHSVGSNRVGPAHQGVFGRRAGAVQDYDYSEAVKKSAIVWTAQNLDRWLSNPEALIPGQKMGYAVSDADDRADLIAYLMTLSATEHHSAPEGARGAPVEGR